MNMIEDVINRPLTNTGLQFGLSTLHAWIRCMECFLHIAYKKSIQTWQARGDKNKAAVNESKTNIQVQLRDTLGLVVDMPRVGGGGTSNDGNTARRFFEHSTLVSEIIGIDKQLLKMVHIILQVLSSGFSIDPDRFQAYCKRVALLYVDLYAWYYMPQSLHRLLIHGHQVVRAMLLPIGMLSEEAQECQNKNFKKFRENFSRKCSRLKTNEDIIRRLLCTSDPYISSIRKPAQKKKKSFSTEALELLKAPIEPGMSR